MFEARFSESSQFRKIIDSMKDLVKNVNIEVTQKGIFIQSIDSCHIALAFLQLKEKAFTNYICQKPLTLGITIEKDKSKSDNICKPCLNAVTILKKSQETLMKWKMQKDDSYGGDERQPGVKRFYFFLYTFLVCWNRHLKI